MKECETLDLLHRLTDSNRKGDREQNSGARQGHECRGWVAGLTLSGLVGQGGLGMGNRDFRSSSYYNFSKRGLSFI